MDSHWFGWDIGGAHLKVAMVRTDGRVEQVCQLPCPLWRGLGELDAAFRALRLPVQQPGSRHAVTMTGELCDSFDNRAQGVRAIADALGGYLGATSTVHFFGGPGRWFGREAMNVDAATEAVASANWLATAAACATVLQDAGVLIDIGSTTTDLVPFAAGKLLNNALTDGDRLAAEELIYTGVVRTPVMAVCSRASYAGRRVMLAAELFATMADVYRLTGELDEACDLYPAADGGEKTLAGSARRLLRMVGRDCAVPADLDAATTLARDLSRMQLRQIEDGLALLLSRGNACTPIMVVAAGAGRFLVPELARRLGLECIDISVLFGVKDELRAAAAVSAPAVAVAQLAAQQL